MPDVHTFSSCGGHKDARPGQAKQGSFYVAFDITPNRQGLRAIAAIQSGIQGGIQSGESWARDSLLLIAWCDPADGSLGGLHFEVEGDGVPPNVLATALQEIRGGGH